MENKRSQNENVDYFYKKALSFGKPFCKLLRLRVRFLEKQTKKLMFYGEFCCFFFDAKQKRSKPWRASFMRVTHIKRGWLSKAKKNKKAVGGPFDC